MSTLTLKIPSKAYRELQQEAIRLDKPIQGMLQDWMIEKLPLLRPLFNEDKTDKVLRDAGLLTELSPELRKLADPTIPLEEVVAFMGEAGGKSLSEIVLEQRRAKEW